MSVNGLSPREESLGAIHQKVKAICIFSVADLLKMSISYPHVKFKNKNNSERMENS